MNSNWQEKNVEELTVESCPATVSATEKVEKNKGVWYNARTRCWLACVRVNGRHLKVFSVKKYGFHKAKMMALQCKHEADQGSGSDSTLLINTTNESRNESNSSTQAQSKSSEMENENEHENENDNDNEHDLGTYDMKDTLNENRNDTKILKELSKMEETKDSYENWKEFVKTERSNSKDSTFRKNHGNGTYRKIKGFKINDAENGGRRYNTRRGTALAKSEENSLNQDSTIHTSIAGTINNTDKGIHIEGNTICDNLKNVKNMRSTYNNGNLNQTNNKINKTMKKRKVLKNSSTKNKRKSDSDITKEKDRNNKIDISSGKRNTFHSIKTKDCILTDKDFQLDSNERENEEAYCFKPHVFEYSDSTHTKSKNFNIESLNSNVTFSDEHHSHNCSSTLLVDQDDAFLDLTREALALILQDLRKNVVPKVPVGIERKARYANALSFCLRLAKATKHFNELEPYLRLFSECIKSSKLPSNMDLQDQLFYLDQL